MSNYLPLKTHQQRQIEPIEKYFKTYFAKGIGRDLIEVHKRFIFVEANP